MNDDFKLLIWLLGLAVIVPIIGMALDDWHKKDCKVELAKAGKTVEEIKEVCK